MRHYEYTAKFRLVVGNGTEIQSDQMGAIEQRLDLDLQDWTQRLQTEHPFIQVLEAELVESALTKRPEATLGELKQMCEHAISQGLSREMPVGITVQRDGVPPVDVPIVDISIDAMSGVLRLVTEETEL